MKRKRIVVMGFMGGMPIAGVIWQHIHYMVGLQRLGHDVYYVEDSARIPYNPETFEVNVEFDYAAKILGQLAHEFDLDRKSTRLNSSHSSISYAVFCLKKKSTPTTGLAAAA